MAELFFLSLAAYLVWYSIRHLRAEHKANGGFLTHPYGHPANGIEGVPMPVDGTPALKAPSGSLDDQPAHVIARIAEETFGTGRR